MARLLRWVADPPRFIEITRGGRPTGKVSQGPNARVLQYQLNTGKSLPPGWIRDWSYEHRGVSGGRRHAFTGGATPRFRTVSQQDILQGRHSFEQTWNGICEWREISQTYVWSSHTWSWMEWVDDRDAKIIFFSCYGEFVDVTDLAVRDEINPAFYVSP